MNTFKEAVKELVREAFRANNAEDEKEKEVEEKEKVDEKVENEDVDKRDLIRQIMAIAGKREDDEDVRTIAKMAEKLAYDKSEAGTADNKCKNEDDEKEEKEEKFEEEKEVADVENKKKVKNSMDDIKEIVYGAGKGTQKTYLSRDERIELGNNY